MKFSEPQSNLIESIEYELMKLAHKWEKFLRSKGSISPAFPGERVKLSKVVKYREVFWLHCIHHFIEDEEVRWLVKAELMDKQQQFGIEERSILDLLLPNKAIMLLYLIESTEFKNPRELFGSLLSSEFQVTRYTLYIHRPRKATRVPRKRGYRDHGSLKPPHKWVETHDFTFVEQQQKIEEERRKVRDTIYFLEGGIT